MFRQPCWHAIFYMVMQERHSRAILWREERNCKIIEI